MQNLQERVFEFAEELVLACYLSTRQKSFSAYFVDAVKIGQVWWDEKGRVRSTCAIKDDNLHGIEQFWNHDDYETTILEFEQEWNHGTLHGVVRRYHHNGSLMHDTHYVNGFEHGVSHQYDIHGRLIGTYELNQGTGLDLWYTPSGVITEARQLLHGQRHGYERWYDGKGRLYEEGYYREGIRHGIFRKWNQKGKLRRGVPQYFVNGHQMNKRQYLAHAREDATLPPFHEDENNPYRN